MENEKENRYFIIWLYISILLHLCCMILFLTMRSKDNLSQTADRVYFEHDGPHIIFVQDQPDPVIPVPNDDYQLKNRIQGEESGKDHISMEQTPPVYDVPEQALSDSYKKGVKNQTNQKDQDEQGTVNIQNNATVDQQVQTEQQILAYDPQPESILQEKIPVKSSPEKVEEPLQPLEQKIVTKLHKTAQLGTENLSKVQISKHQETTPPEKNKISLKDLQQGFSQFVQAGNEHYFSHQGNAQQDDAQGLKRASYYKQLGQMYKNAHAIAPHLLNPSQYQTPSDNSVIAITIDRSGKIIHLQMVTTSGVDMLDRHHIKIIESIGSFPPVPKFIEAPLQVTATLRFLADRSSAGTFIPNQFRH